MIIVEKHLPTFDCSYVINFNDRDKMLEFYDALVNTVDLEQIENGKMKLEVCHQKDKYYHNPHIKLGFIDRMTFDHRLNMAINHLFSPFNKRKIEYKKLLKRYSEFVEQCYIEVICYENPKAEMLDIELCIYDKAFQTIRSFNTEIYITHFYQHKRFVE